MLSVDLVLISFPKSKLELIQTAVDEVATQEDVELPQRLPRETYTSAAEVGADVAALGVRESLDLEPQTARIWARGDQEL